MNWKIIFQLSIFWVDNGFRHRITDPRKKLEPAFWLVIFIFLRNKLLPKLAPVVTFCMAFW